MTARERSKSSKTEVPPLSGFACHNGRPSLVFGQRPDGSIAHISEVPRGKECGCVCPGCGSPLVARQGQVLDHHFGHLATSDGSPCRTGPETALHMFAKELLARELRLTLPPVQLDDGVETWSKFPGGNYSFDSAVLENKLGDIIPDVVVTRKGRDLIVEFVVTHECSPEKIAKIQKLDVTAVEIYLSDLAADASKEEVEKGILDTCRRKWLHNPLFREGTAALDALRIERDRELAERAAVLSEVYSEGSAEVRPLAALSPEYQEAIDLGLGGCVGMHVAGLGCFTVSPHDWQATYLVAMAPKPNERGTSLIIPDILRDMIQRGWVRPEFRSLNADLVNAIKARQPEFVKPHDAVGAWLHELRRHDWLGLSKPDDEWSTEHAWSMTDRANRIILGAYHKRELPRLRTEKIRKLATEIIRQLPEHETASFDLDAWFSRTLPGREYSMAQAIEFDLGPYSSVMSELASLLWNIRLKPSPQSDFMGLPLQAELERSVERERQEEELRETERRERPLHAARHRADRILQEAWAAIGVDADQWVHTKLEALGGMSPSETAYESEEGFDAALTVLDGLARQRDLEMRRAQAAAQARKGFRKAAAKVFQGQHLELFMKASHPALGRKSPNDYCVDEVSMNQCIGATLPAAKRRR